MAADFGSQRDASLTPPISSRRWSVFPGALFPHRSS